MEQYIAGNEEAFILLNKENDYSYLMTDLSLKTKVYGFFSQPQSRYISQVATTGRISSDDLK